MQKCPQFGKNYKITALSSSAIPSTKKQEENGIKSHRNEMAQKAVSLGPSFKGVV